MLKEKECRILINMVQGIGPRTYKRLMGHFGSAVEVSAASLGDLRGMLDEQLSERLRRYFNDKSELETELELIDRNGIKVIFWDDNEYPDSFKNIDSPPPVVYIKGDCGFFRHRLTISIVGTRRPTPYGKRVAGDLTGDLVGFGFYTTSGFALGVDSIVHRATLEKGSATAAVLGCGLLVDYPYPNKDIRERVTEKGVMLSEFPLRFPPLPDNFPRRNRLIAALGIGTLVIEANEKSGSMITVSEALNQGKDVFSVPGSIYSPYSKGTNKLIAQGAKLVSCAQDILDEFDSKANYEFEFAEKNFENRETPLSDIRLNDSERNILNLIGWEPSNIEKITECSGKLSYELARILMDLEIKGFIQALPGKQYIRMKQ